MPRLKQMNLDAVSGLGEATLSRSFPCKMLDAGGRLELQIYDFIGEPDTDSSAAQVAKILAENKGKPVSVRINSTGGLAYSGIAIYNELVNHDAAIDVTITGIAASAASIIAMAGDVIRIAENAQIMIHNSWSLAIGNAEDMRVAAGVLDGLDKLIAETYAARTGETAADMAALMAAESYFGGQDAVDLGLADELLSAKQRPKPANHTAEVAAMMQARVKQLRAETINSVDAA